MRILNSRVCFLHPLIHRCSCQATTPAMGSYVDMDNLIPALFSIPFTTDSWVPTFGKDSCLTLRDSPMWRSIFTSSMCLSLLPLSNGLHLISFEPCCLAPYFPRTPTLSMMLLGFLSTAVWVPLSSPRTKIFGRSSRSGLQLRLIVDRRSLECTTVRIRRRRFRLVRGVGGMEREPLSLSSFERGWGWWEDVC